tara:strand:- start:45 stop:539 length:495 start_codon:yes stop_codon:yes gene_type:complete
MPYATGKYAKFISDRSGMEYPYTEMVVEWNGARVHTSEFEPKTPQDRPNKHSPDAESLQFPRPAREEPATERLLPLNPFKLTASSTTVSVFEPGHSRSTGDTVRFRTVSDNLFGASKSEIEVSSGFSITKTDDDFYTFTVTTAPSTTGSAGGEFVSSGPVTVSN